MIDMKLTVAEAKASTYLGSPSTDDADLPKYPYGLMLDLDDEVLAKLGLETPPAVGTTLMLMARVQVTRISSNEQQDGEKETCMGLQITEMELKPEATTPASRFPNSGMTR